MYFCILTVYGKENVLPLFKKVSIIPRRGNLPKIPELVCYSDGHHYLTHTVLLQELIIDAALCFFLSRARYRQHFTSSFSANFFFTNTNTNCKYKITKSCKKAVHKMLMKNNYRYKTYFLTPKMLVQLTPYFIKIRIH